MQLADTLHRDMVQPESTFIDEKIFARDPYYTGKDPFDYPIGVGQSGFATRPAAFPDAPFLNVPPGFAKIQALFEVNAYCVKGEARGEWLGKTFWYYERVTGSAMGRIGRAPGTGPDRGPRTSRFMRALDLFNQNHNYAFPSSIPTKAGGVRCPQFTNLP
jgi:hypothetical protein